MTKRQREINVVVVIHGGSSGGQRIREMVGRILCGTLQWGKREERLERLRRK